MVKRYRIGVMRGDGIGPEVVDSALRVLKAAVDQGSESDIFEYLYLDVGWSSYKKFDTSLTSDVLSQLQETDAWILGPIEAGSYPEAVANPSGRIRKHFDLYGNLRPAKSFGFNPCYKSGQVDLIIVRENTEGFYADRNMYEGSGEVRITADISLAIGVFKREACRRIIRLGFEYAQHRHRKITAVHKANVLRRSNIIFLEEFRKACNLIPDVQANDKMMDAMAYELIVHPELYDVIVTTNMFGDILSDEAAGITGSLGLAPSLNVGDRYAMAQAVHGTAPDIAGKGIANPLAEIMSVSMLTEWLSNRHDDSALVRIHKSLETAIEATMTGRQLLTPDLGGSGTTASVTDSVIRNLRASRS